MLDFGPYLRFGPICHPLDLVHNTSMAIAGRPGRRASRIHARKAGVLDLLKADAWERRTLRWREVDSNLYGAFPVKWCFSVYCQFFVRRCVQVRRACSAGDSPAGVKVRAP